jgi:hypothetical protein
MTALDETTTAFDVTISNEPAVRIITVTPTMAADWLETRNQRNRNISPKRVAGYIAEIQRGDWRFNGDSIRFDVHGNLLDGQHRLAAVAQAGVPLRFVLAVGLPPEAQDTMDLGAKRSIGNILQLRGVPDTNNMAAAAQLCWGYVNNTLSRGDTASRRGTPHQVASFVDEHLETLHAAILQASALKKMLPVRKSTAAAAYWIIAQADPDNAARFWGPLLDGAGLVADSPILLLRNRLTREAGAPRKAETRQILAAYVKAWNAWAEDRVIQLLIWKDNEGFPQARKVTR